jgi:hypothetical protein
MSSFNWKGLIGSVAPTLATALGGPLAGMAVQAIGGALGLSDATEEKLSAALAGAKPEDLIALKTADQAFAAKMKELDIKVEELETKDRDSARNLMVQTHSRTPAVLSYFIVVVTAGIYTYLVAGEYDKLTVSDLVLGRILGTLDMAFGVVLAYWLGSAHHQQNNAPTK